MITAIYNCFSIPFKISFQPVIMDNNDFFIISQITDSIFVIDMILNFRLAYIDKKGNTIEDGRSIAINYLKSYFWIDLLATLPFDIILEAASGVKKNSYELTGILKLGRLFKLKVIIGYMNVVEDLKQLMKLC